MPNIPHIGINNNDSTRNIINTIIDFINSGAMTGKSAFEIWKAMSGNENKNIVDFFNAMKGEGLQIDGYVNQESELPEGDTKATYLVDTYLYFRGEGSIEWKKGAEIKGENGTVVTVGIDGYIYIDGIKTEHLVDVTKYKHTHKASEVIFEDGNNLEDVLDGGSQDIALENYYPKDEIDRTVINANRAFGFIGDGTSDNYGAFKKAAAFNKSNPNIMIEFDGMYQGNEAVYRVNQFVTIKNIDGVPVDGGITNVDWTGKNVFLKTNGAKFVSMPVNGFIRNKDFTTAGGHYSKEEPVCLFNFVNNDNVMIDSLFVDGENYKMRFGEGITSSKEGVNPKYSDGIQMIEGRGHGVCFSAVNNVKIGRLKSINAIVDGIAISFKADYNNMTVKQTTHFDISNIETYGCGRLGVSGLGLSSGKLTNLLAEYNGLNKNADGLYVGYAPMGGVDIEPHHSPISMDNKSSTSYTTEDWNGNLVIENARVRYNANIQIACTSTLLTRNVIWERLVVRPAKNRTVGNHTLIQTSLQNCTFRDVDIDGELSDGSFSRLLLYGAGIVNESTGVITGEQANVWSKIEGGRLSNIEPWVNTDGNTTINDAKAGEYGFHNVIFRDLIMENVKLTLRSIRRFLFDNVVMTIPSNSTITKIYLWNAMLKNVVILNKKSTSITLDLGSGEHQSNFENLRLTTNKFDWSAGTKKYKTGVLTSELLDVYDYTKAMEFVFTNTVSSDSATSSNNLWKSNNVNWTGKTITEAGGTNQKVALNTVFTYSANDAFKINLTANDDTVTMTNAAGIARLGYFTLSPNTDYTIRIQATDTIANGTDLVYMLGNNNFIIPNPKTLDITFTTDSSGKFGRDQNGVIYGSAGSEWVFQKANGAKTSNTTYKIWLNKGTTSTADWI